MNQDKEQYVLVNTDTVDNDDDDLTSEEQQL